MINVKYESSFLIKTLYKVVFFLKYNIVRPLISFVLWKIKPNKNTCYLDYNDKPLKDGISFCVPAYNEEVTVTHCLNSLLGFVNQIIFIDNGSTDNTLKIVKKFKERNKHKLDIKILFRPGEPLYKIREEATTHVKYKWFIRGDADMVFKDKFKSHVLNLIKKQNRPAAFRIKYFHPFGNLSHYHIKFGSQFNGEFYLRSYDRNIKYIEYNNRLEHATVPIFYKMKTIDEIGFLHLDSFKENERFFHRTCYLDWREVKEKITLQEYKEKWIQHNFKSKDPNVIFYRQSLMIASMCRIDPQSKNKLKDFPEIFKNDSYEVFYENNKPLLRFNKNYRLKTLRLHEKFKTLNWSPDIDKYYSDSIRQNFNIDSQ